MPSQIFKTSPNKEIFFSLIKKNGFEKFNNYEKLNSFVFNKASFKKPNLIMISNLFRNP